MHICFQAVDYPQKGMLSGGVGTMTHMLAGALVKKGHHVSVLAYNKLTDNTERVIEDGINVYRFPNKYGVLNYWYINKLIREINRNTPIDIYDCTELNLAFIVKLKTIKYIIRLNGGHHYFAFAEKRPTEWRKVWMEKRSFKKADALIAVSNYVHEKTKELIGFNLPVKVISNPVDTNVFSPRKEQSVVPGRMVFVGTVVEKKGIRQLIQAMPKIKKVIDNAHLIVLGRDAFIPGTKKSYRDYLNDFLPNNYEEYITFKGAVAHQEVESYIQDASVCVYPSHMEAMPLAWLEALAIGKPFVGSKTGPGPEAVKDGETGLLCDPFNPDDIAEKVIWMLQNKEAAQKMGLAARADVQERFNIQNLVNENIDFYQKCIND